METKQIKGRKQFDGNLRSVCSEIWGKNEHWDLGGNTHERFMSAGTRMWKGIKSVSCVYSCMFPGGLKKNSLIWAYFRKVK